MTPGDGSKMAASILTERLGYQHPARPRMHSQHSSSMPSTPYQQPRDLKFHSRSPSPNRGLSNQSPQSVVSELVGQSGAHRNTPVVCKFETGAEIRKRRIPYVDGGDEELGPPKKEPKRTLERDEHEKLSSGIDELYSRLLPSPESEDRRTRLVTKLERMLNDEWPGDGIRVHVFGSSGNLLSSSDSDVDICITTSLKKLESMHAIATLLARNGMEKVVCRASAKVPIVKCWDPELKLAADLNVNNTLALENTRMIKTYVQLDNRVRPLAKIIKYWTKRRILNDAAFGGTISSYTWICMILNFLQRRDPPILPSLQKRADRRKRSDDSVEHTEFADDMEALKGCGDANKETLAELLFQFFRHYAYEFDYSNYVVSVREGRLLSRKEKRWDRSNYQEKEARNRLCVEEPFTVIRNLGNSADEYAWTGIHGEIRRAFELLSDGSQLEKCCEEYEFPPEEKPIFQRPAPKPKPTLTRSASQSGRPNHEPGSGRSRKGGNRNQSAQRAGNRRASSGATFSNQRVPLGFQSPPVGAAVMDYFGMKGDLHNQLYQQYQYLQAQTDALRTQASQLAQQQNVQAHAQGRAGDLAGLPHQRPLANGLPSPRSTDAPPQTAPLLPAYLYPYPARYPPPSPMSQTRSRDGINTNPSSPSTSSAVPALRRQAHRGSIPEGSSSILRSQSQPGRSLHHPLTLQQQAQLGYDISGAIIGQQPTMRSSSQPYSQGQGSLQTPFSPLSAGHPMGQPIDSAMPKEYMGYYMQSPSLGPQYAHVAQMPVPPMPLRDPPLQRPRKITPDLMPPILNGKHSSRSPSPLGHPRSYATTNNVRTASDELLQSQPVVDQPVAPAPPLRSSQDAGGPLIVNGSTPAAPQKPLERINGVSSLDNTLLETAPPGIDENELLRQPSLPLRPLDTTFAGERAESLDRLEASPRIVSSPRFKSGHKIAMSPNGTAQNHTAVPEPLHLDSTPISAPLLSPVAELRTPSPTHGNVFEKDSPRANGWVKAAKIANAKQVERRENEMPKSPPKGHERKGSAPNPITITEKPAKSPILPSPPGNANQNPWQVATSTRKSHKKSKSTAQARTVTSEGQPLPANESERKGG